MARNLLRQQAAAGHRRRLLAERIAALTSEADVTAWDAGEHVVERAAALDALALLSERDVEALTLATWHGLDIRAAASVVGCTPPAFAVRLHRARRRLNAALRAADRAEKPSATTAASAQGASWQVSNGVVGFIEGDLPGLTAAQFRQVPTTPADVKALLRHYYVETNCPSRPASCSTEGQFLWSEALALLRDPVSAPVRSATFKVMASLPGVWLLGPMTDPLVSAGWTSASPVLPPPSTWTSDGSLPGDPTLLFVPCDRTGC